MSAAISIIVPVYNGEKYLMRCLESIEKQTFSNFEVLLVDDGSTDQSQKIEEAFQKKDTRVRLLKKKNGGVSSARNVGLANAAGKFITFIDADDYVGRQYLEMLLEAMNRTKTDLIISNAIDVKEGRIQKTKCRLENEKIFSRKEVLLEMFQSTLFSHVCWGNLYKSSIACQCAFDEKLKVAEDGKFLYDYLRKSENITVTEERQYYYCYHTESTVHAGFTDQFFDEVDMYFEAYQKFFYDKEIRRTIAEKIFRYLKHLQEYPGISRKQQERILEYYQRGLTLDCRRKIRKSIKYCWYRIMETKQSCCDSGNLSGK